MRYISAMLATEPVICGRHGSTMSRHYESKPSISLIVYELVGVRYLMVTPVCALSAFLKLLRNQWSIVDSLLRCRGNNQGM